MVWLVMPCLACLSINSVPARAQSVGLPAPRLLATFPMGGQAGSEVEITIRGESIDPASELVFSNDGIRAVAKRDEKGNAVPNTFLVSIAEDCPTGIHEARVLTSLGLSTPRVFTVGHLRETTQTESSTSPESPHPLAIDSVCNAVMPVRAINHYRFTASEGQRIFIECAARRIDSKLRPVVILSDTLGRDLLVERTGDPLDFTAPADGDYLIKVHELTFQGGADFFYRLALSELSDEAKPVPDAGTVAVSAASWPPESFTPGDSSPETEPNDQATEAQTITPPCQLAGTFFPAADVDVFEFTAKKGQTWWIEVGSQRLGLPTDPSVLVQRVVPPLPESKQQPTLVDVALLSDIPSPVKVSGNNYAYDGPPYNVGSSDVLGKLEIPEDGLYRLELSDLFGGTRQDPRNRYHLVIRQASPDFVLVAWAMHMELRNGDRNALSKPIALRPGATMPLEVVAIRRDGFDGAIELSMDLLPPGVTADGLTIPAGQSRGVMLVTADAEAPPGWSRARLVGRSEIDGKPVTRTCRLASMAWPVKDAWAEIPHPRLLADVPVSVGSAEIAPLTVQPRSPETIQVQEGQSLTLPVDLIRRSEFSGTKIRLEVMGHGFEKHPKIDLDLNQDSADVVLDLAKLKVAPGQYKIALCGSVVAKYSPQAIALSDLVDAPTKPVPTKDIVDIVVSRPFTIEVQPAKKP
ncbi:serine protease [Roseiconus nitratireducens]|uniref:Serine protease n=2 Tax=Roseiconus nitratireducens TaxID=2605748 RepID=A0A5M6D5W5_9BACT|nr:serine protease [Roseiconus nitratireducens]